MAKTQAESDMGIEKNKQVIKAFFDAGANDDMDACFALLTEDIKWTIIGSTKFSGAYVGKQVLAEQLLGPLFEQLEAGISTVVENMIAEGDLVVAETSGTAETKDGKAYNNTYCMVIRLRDGKIVEVKEYFDTELASMVFGRD